MATSNSKRSGQASSSTDNSSLKNTSKQVTKKFRVTYFHPVLEVQVQEIVEYADSYNPYITAREWAEDYAYTKADKGPYSVELIRN